jgi:ketosteroid isomerase-like protein
LIPAAGTDIVGKNAIKEHYRNLFSNSSLQLKASTTEIIDGKDLAVIRGFTTGKVISKMDSSSATVNDKFLMLLKKQSGQWKIYRLTWSRNE